MKIGVPKEVKNNEFRVGLTPESVAKLVKSNHEVFIQTNAGAEIGFLIQTIKQLEQISLILPKSYTLIFP